MVKKIVKRSLDVIVAFIVLVLTLPLAIFILVLILLFVGRPILFRQERPGLNAKPFIIYKFRTMTSKLDKSGKLLPDQFRMTKLGTWLRRSSFDELPTFLNVLRGDMSLVGPRPLLMEYLELYSKEQMTRHNVRPGITGLAQVNGRNKLTWEEKFKLDVWYVNNYNFMLDVKILFKTILLVIRSTGINQEGHVTTEKFRGSK